MLEAMAHQSQVNLYTVTSPQQLRKAFHLGRVGVTQVSEASHRQKLDNQVKASLLLQGL